MIDLILWATDRATLRTFAQNNNLLVQDDEGNWKPRDGLEWDWWGGTGKLMRTQGTYDAEGNELTAPTYIPGEVLLLRIHGDFFNTDRLEPDEADPDKAEQWARSKVARFIKNNGTPGTVQGVNYYELDGVRIFRAADVQAKLVEWGVPGHEWLGGNSY